MLTQEERELVRAMRTLTSNPTVEYMVARDVPRLLDIIEGLEARLKRAADLVPWMREGRDGRAPDEAYRDCGNVLNAALNETITIVVNARKRQTYEHLVHVAGMTGQPTVTVRFPEIELVDGLVVTCANTVDS
jgi:hypothetical protein